MEQGDNILPAKRYNTWQQLDFWRYYNKDAISPDSYIDLGFIYMIAAALERRVWLGPVEKPLFPNLFLVLVGEPGIGKGQVIGPVTEFLTFHKDFKGEKNDVKILTPDMVEHQQKAQAIRDTVLSEAAMAGALAGKDKNNIIHEERSLFRQMPDSVTFEKLVSNHAKALKALKYKCELDGKEKKYLHASVFFSLEEMSSLFKRKTEDVADYLLTAFDCKNYSYETIGRGSDLVRKCCLNLLAGTTPGFLRKSFRGSLIEEGLSARITFVYEFANRVNKFPEFKDLDDTQKQCRAAILDHLKKLSTLYGRVTLTPEAQDYLHKYFSQDISEIRLNKNIKLIPWYARKNIHLPKFAMAIHFSRSLDFELTLQDILDAQSILLYLERNMHHALDFDGNNPLSGPIKNIVKFLRNHKMRAATRNQIWAAFVGDLRTTELDEALDYLKETGTVEIVSLPNPSGQMDVFYRVKE